MKENKQKRFECVNNEQCLLMFQGMEEDQLFGENSQLKEFQCPVCLKQFSRKFTLDMHLLIHKGIKPHPCPFCGKCFRQKGTLMRHKALHSSNNLFHCSLCDRGFRQKNVFLHHLKHRHNVSTETLDRRKYRTELKDYQSIMDTLPPFVHADSTAIASSEKHLDAMLFESLNNTVCDSSGAEGTTEQVEGMGCDKQKLISTNMQTTPSSLKRSEISDNSFKGFGYECNFCLKMYFEYNQYKQHIEENHNNEEALLECKPILLPLDYQGNETPPLDYLSPNNEESTANPKLTDNHLYSNNNTHHNSFNGVSSTNDVRENVNLCIPCQQNFRTSEEFECHVKTHVQSVLLGDGETNKDIKSTPLNSNSSDLICENESKILSFNESNEIVPQPLTNDTSEDQTMSNEMRKFRNSQISSLTGDDPKDNATLISPVRSPFRNRFHTQLQFPDSASSYISKVVPTKNNQSPTIINQKSFLYDCKTKSKNLPVSKQISSSGHNLLKCKLCEKSYRSKLSYEYHMQMHMSSKSFNCGYCKKRFSSKHLLLSHTRSSHMKSFHCSSCFRSFNYRTLYFQHKKHCSEASSKLQNLKNVINLPLVNIQKLLNSDTNGIIGVIPISNPGNSDDVNAKVGIPIISLSSIKNMQCLPLLSSSIEISGVLK